MVPEGSPGRPSFDLAPAVGGLKNDMSLPKTLTKVYNGSVVLFSDVRGPARKLCQSLGVEIREVTFLIKTWTTKFEFPRFV